MKRTGLVSVPPWRKAVTARVPLTPLPPPMKTSPITTLTLKLLQTQETRSPEQWVSGEILLKCSQSKLIFLKWWLILTSDKSKQATLTDAVLFFVVWQGVVCEEIVIDSDGRSTLIRSGHQANSMMLDFYNRALKRKKVCLCKHTIKVCVSCSCRCPGTSAQSKPQSNYFLCSSNGNA